MKDDQLVQPTDGTVSDAIATDNSLSLGTNPSEKQSPQPGGAPPKSENGVAFQEASAPEYTPADQDSANKDSQDPAFEQQENQVSQSQSKPGEDDNKTDPVLDPLKKQTLVALGPIIDELDLTAEEKFRVMLMVIQASDDKKLLDKAYKLAENIKDKKVRARALFSVINEIEYFAGKEST